jgi:hypothetical protein
MMDWVEAMKVWQAARRFSARTLQHLRDLLGQLKRTSKNQLPFHRQRISRLHQGS